MNKKNNYWFIGGIAAVVVILLILLAVSYNRSRNGRDENSLTGEAVEESSSLEDGASISGQSTMDHNAMGHGAMEHGTMGADDDMEDESLTAYLSDQDKIMTDMMRSMAEVEKSGNASINFLEGMIPHHESAIEMAESYLKYGGKNQQLKEMAESIIETQTDEVWQMKSLIDELKALGQTDEDKEEAYLKEYNEMMAAHHEGHSAGDSVDQAFAEGMHMHHQMAVDMSKAILNYADEGAVKMMAQNIIRMQEEEMAQMESILQELQKENNQSENNQSENQQTGNKQTGNN
ncbi:DUF305 domain-containing protein [Clostridium sp. MCC353]|uniref:DUF305 domain-containing protein n=1 Tax=Clostridium sp. MCC353 TaxID=2592646 RepID=UPI001C02622A|nr:DUF305 domain-containing protein [Clostridium sp. MCC353]MBT9779237.1 DUF305 domain-containing protein [Clostridium sp. MCC353]